jgi:autotransporter-associated beta strand protein
MLLNRAFRVRLTFATTCPATSRIPAIVVRTPANIVIGLAGIRAMIARRPQIVRIIADQLVGNNMNLIMNGLIVSDAGQEGKAYIFQPNGNNGVIVFNNDNNSFTHYPHMRTGITEVATIANAGVNSALGAGNHFTFGQQAVTGTLRYVGTGNSTDRQVRVGNGDNNATWNGGGIILNNGTGALNFTNATFSRVADAALTSRTLTLGGNYTGTNTISGMITDNNLGGIVGVEVSGSTWQLDGASSYTGNTTVSGGTLLLNGSTSADSTVTVAAGGTLGGNGTINGNLTLADGAFLAFDHTAFDPTDPTDLSGTLKLGSASVFTLDNSFGVASLRDLNGGELDWGTIAGGTYTLLSGDNLPIFDATLISNFGFDSRATGLGGGREAYFQNGSLQLVVIPEPGTWALLAGVLALGIVVLRRRRG